MNRLTYALAAAFFAFGSAGPAWAANSCTTPANVNAMASEIVAGVNANRRANGQGALRFSQELSQAAMRHACDMSINGFFGHNGTDGSDPFNRVRAVGYGPCLAAENLAWGYPRSEQIISGWMNSSGHRSNMLHPRASEVGIGITDGAKGPNWVLVVARSGC